MTARIQWRHQDRLAGRKLPPGAKLVTRASRWGNPYPVCQHRTREQAVNQFAQMLATRMPDPAANCRCMRRDPNTYPSDAEIRTHLAGYDLACACDFAGPCHGDILLRVAAGEGPAPTAMR
jgi:Domain of unknown function (DUF4326)